MKKHCELLLWSLVLHRQFWGKIPSTTVIYTSVLLKDPRCISKMTILKSANIKYYTKNPPILHFLKREMYSQNVDVSDVDRLKIVDFLLIEIFQLKVEN